MISLGRGMTRKSLSSIRLLHLGSRNEPRKIESAPKHGCCQNWTLYNKLKSSRNKKGMVTKILNQYIKHEKMPNKYLLHCFIRQLRKRRIYHTALEIMEWMESKCFFEMGFKDYPSYLDLLGKVEGVEVAEKFFDGLSPEWKNIGTYGALLNLYCKEKMEDKACALFTEMEKNDCVTPLSFSCLISLYMRLEKPEKVSPLVEMMKQRNLELSTYTYNIWMTSCSHLDDVEGAERVFEEIKRENKCDWTTYSNLAVIYVKSDLHAKAELVLKKLEQEMGPQNRAAYHYLLTLYAGISNLDEVHRIWNSMKSEYTKINNRSCSIMLQALGKLDDIVGLKKCYEEWKSSCYSYDERIGRSVIIHYLRHDMLNEAQMVFHHVTEGSKPPYFIIFEIFMTYHLRNNQVEQALHWLNDAASQVEESRWKQESGWKLNFEITNDFLTTFEKTGDVRSAEEFCKLLKKLSCLESFVYSSLLKTYIAAGKSAADLRERIKDDGFVIDDDLRHLLDRVCY